MENIYFISPNNSAEENRLWGPQAHLEVALLSRVPNSASVNTTSTQGYPLWRITTPQVINVIAHSAHRIINSIHGMVYKIADVKENARNLEVKVCLQLTRNKYKEECYLNIRLDTVIYNSKQEFTCIYNSAMSFALLLMDYIYIS